MNTPGMSVQAGGSGKGGSIWRRVWRVIDERTHLSALAYPVPRHANRLPYILGGISVVGIVVLFATGIWLGQFYNPDPTHAHDSMHYIVEQAPLGKIVRGIHVWSANILLITILLHLARTFTTGSYKRPREVNWWSGLALLGVIIAFTFTGTILKWDQEGFEALSHNLEIAKLIGVLGFWFSDSFQHSVPILNRLYIAHVAILPVLLIALLAAHLALVKVHGISPLPEVADRAVDGGPAPEYGGSTFTHHVSRMAVYGLILLAVALVLGLIWPPFFGEPPNPNVENTKPPWPFLPVYPLEGWFSVNSLIWGPALIFGALAILPIADRNRYSASRRRRIWIALGALLAITLIGLGIYAAVAPAVPHIPENMNGM